MVDFLITAAIICIYICIGLFIAAVLGFRDELYYIGFAIFWPVMWIAIPMCIIARVIISCGHKVHLLIKYSKLFKAEKCCEDCKHHDKRYLEEPCKRCKRYSLWEI